MDGCRRYTHDSRWPLRAKGINKLHAHPGTPPPPRFAFRDALQPMDYFFLAYERGDCQLEFSFSSDFQQVYEAANSSSLPASDCGNPVNKAELK